MIKKIVCMFMLLQATSIRGLIQENILQTRLFNQGALKQIVTVKNICLFIASYIIIKSFFRQRALSQKFIVYQAANQQQNNNLTTLYKQLAQDCSSFQQIMSELIAKVKEINSAQDQQQLCIENIDAKIQSLEKASRELHNTNTTVLAILNVCCSQTSKASS